jgi:hypothetical protein
MVKTSDGQKKSKREKEILQVELVRELKHLRSLAHEVCGNFTLRREGDIETIITSIDTLPRKTVREMMPEWLRDIRSLKLKPHKGRLRDIKEINRIITGFKDQVLDAREKQGQNGKTPSTRKTDSTPAQEETKRIK